MENNSSDLHMGCYVSTNRCTCYKISLHNFRHTFTFCTCCNLCSSKKKKQHRFSTICSEHLENLQFVNVWFIFAFTTLQSPGRRRLQTTGLSRFNQAGWFWLWGYLGCIHNTLQKPDLWEGPGTESHRDDAVRRSIIYFLWRWHKRRCQMQSRIPAHLQRLQEGSVCVRQQLSLCRVSVSHTNST